VQEEKIGGAGRNLQKIIAIWIVGLFPFD